MVALTAVLLTLFGGAAWAQTLTTEDTKPVNLKPTASCPQSEIDRLQQVISFVEGRSWEEQPGSHAFLLSPDTAKCRVVLKINKVSTGERAALEKGGGAELSIEKTKDYAKPSKLPLILWVIFGGAGVVFVFIRYGRR